MDFSDKKYNLWLYATVFSGWALYQILKENSVPQSHSELIPWWVQENMLVKASKSEASELLSISICLTFEK